MLHSSRLDWNRYLFRHLRKCKAGLGEYGWSLTHTSIGCCSSWRYVWAGQLGMCKQTRLDVTKCKYSHFCLRYSPSIQLRAFTNAIVLSAAKTRPRDRRSSSSIEECIEVCFCREPDISGFANNNQDLEYPCLAPA